MRTQYNRFLYKLHLALEQFQTHDRMQKYNCQHIRHRNDRKYVLCNPDRYK